MKKNWTPDRPKKNSLATTARGTGSAMTPNVPTWNPNTSIAPIHRNPVNDGRRGFTGVRRSTPLRRSTPFHSGPCASALDRSHDHALDEVALHEGVHQHDRGHRRSEEH